MMPDRPDDPQDLTRLSAFAQIVEAQLPHLTWLTVEHRRYAMVATTECAGVPVNINFNLENPDEAWSVFIESTPTLEASLRALAVCAGREGE